MKTGVGEQTKLLHGLIQHRGLKEGEYALFFVTGEGGGLPAGPRENRIEEASGYVLDRLGRVFSFWLGWDSDRREAALTEWREIPPEPLWSHDPEYRRARKRVGLPS